MIPILALLLLACGVPDAATTTEAGGRTTTAAPSTTTLPGVEPTVLAYGLEAGQVYVYEVDLNQEWEMTRTGDQPPGGGPEHVVVRMSGVAQVTYEVGPGAEPEHFEITITADLGDVTFDAVVDGEPAEFERLRGPIPTHVGRLAVDRLGRWVGDSYARPRDIFDPLLTGSNGHMWELAEIVPVEFFGPPLADGVFAVGETWNETMEFQWIDDQEAGELGVGPERIQPTKVEVTTTVDRVEELGGKKVLVFDTVVSSSEARLDLGWLMSEIYLGMSGVTDTSDPTWEVFEDIEYLITKDPTVRTMTTWLDPETGFVVRSQVRSESRVTTDVRMPDFTARELDPTGSGVPDLTDDHTTESIIAQDLEYRLVSGP